MIEQIQRLSDEEIIREQATWLMTQHARLVQELPPAISYNLPVPLGGGVTEIIWRERLDERSRWLSLPM